MPQEPETKWVVPTDLTEEEIADAQSALADLAKHLGRISARACHELEITFDMDDPEIAREVIKMTFEALFYSQPQPSRRALERTNQESR